MPSSDPLVAALVADCDGAVQAPAPLAPLTTLKVGGPARVRLTAAGDADLAVAGRCARDHGVPWLVVGRGSNLLVADAGWPGIAITLGSAFRGVAVDGDRVTAGAAESLPGLATRLADAGFAGFAWAAAVPGSVGGAVRMNAGAHGGEMSQHLVEVEVVGLSDGRRRTLPAAALALAYRHSRLPPDAVVVAATLALARGDAETARADIDAVRRWRRRHQPLNHPNCGSVFTNPPGDSAGRLVEAVGAKGLTVGGASVSERHANFIVTRPDATAADVHALIGQLRRRIADRFGLELEPEVVMCGFAEAPAAAPTSVTGPLAPSSDPPAGRSR